MNARLDLLAPASSSNSSAAPAAVCCPRYRAGTDTAPSLFAGAAVACERSAEAVFRFLNRVLCCVSYPRV